MSDGLFAERFAGATQQEKIVIEVLERDYGCKVYCFGQVQLPHEARAYLKSHPDRPFARWLPDLLVVRRDLCLVNVSEYMWLVDVKSGRLDTLNWTLEQDAHKAHRLQREALGLPIVYIWPDGCSCYV